jgi:hypothetical protein
MPWYDWDQRDLPCLFSRERAQENRSFLEHALDAVSLAIDGPQPRDGLLQDTWRTTGAGAFIEINSLAEDLRLLLLKPGVSPVLRDLMDPRLSQPTWHTIHTAALFERARPGAVINFVDARNEKAPDFIVKLHGERVSVEAKLLTLSKAEERFQTVAKEIVDALQTPHAIVPRNTNAIVVLKQPVSANTAAHVADFCKHRLPLYVDATQVHRGPACNQLLEPISPPPGLSDYCAQYVLAPVPDSENIRVLQRAKKASKQLRLFPTTRDSGIVSIGLSDTQDSSAVFEHINERIRRGRFSGIAAVLLLKRRTLLDAPRRTTLDLFEVRRNPSAKSPIPEVIPLRPLDGAALLSHVEPSIGGVRAYRLGVATGRVVDPTRCALPLPDIRVLTPDMLL